MTKSEMMASFDDVVADRRLSRDRVEAHLAASAHEPRLLLGEYVCLASGGSSGERGVFVQALPEYADFLASVMRPVAAELVAAGGPMVVATVAAGSPVHSTGFAMGASGGLAAHLRTPATLPVEDLVDRLNQLGPHLLMGYPSKLAQLGREQRAGRLRIAPRLVVATSEPLTDEDRAAITDAFGVPVVGQFASTEGLVGHGKPGATALTFATDMCLVEPVDVENRAVTAGEPAAKVLVTNLHNFTQPLIRYELTDRFLPSADSDRGHLRAAVDGRSDDVFRYGEVEVHPLVVRTVMVRTAAVHEYQVHQTEKGIRVDVVADGPLSEQVLIAELQDSMRRAGVPDAEVVVLVVSSIERHPDTGKARRFVPSKGAPSRR